MANNGSVRHGDGLFGHFRVLRFLPKAINSLLFVRHLPPPQNLPIPSIDGDDGGGAFQAFDNIVYPSTNNGGNFYDEG
jgi:hypothetical protein